MTAIARTEARPVSLDEMQAFAEAAVKSKFYGFASVDQMLPLMIIAQSEGRSFASVVQEYSVIQGRPALKAESMLARFQKAGGHISWKELSDTRCAAVFSHPQCDPVEVDWDMDRARQAGLAGRGPWKTYPRAMLKARVISDGVRTAYPACLGGMYTPEEVSDFTPAHSPHTPSVVRGTLAAPTDAGQHETQSEPPSSLKHSFNVTGYDDGNGPGKSAHQAKKDGDWERVRERLLEEMGEQATRAECEAWWKRLVKEDAEYQALPKSFRQMLYETDYLPHLEDLPEVVG